MKMALIRFVVSLFLVSIFYAITVDLNIRNKREKNNAFIERNLLLCVIVCVLFFLSLIAVVVSICGIIMALPI
jgi:hypothetical protein